MDETQCLTYVSATSAALGLTPDAARDARISANLFRSAAIAQLLDHAPLAAHDELAEIFRPAPFPTQGAGES